MDGTIPISKYVKIKKSLVKNSKMFPAITRFHFSYQYEWRLISQSSDKISGSMENSHSQQLKVTNLKEGFYQFSVTVTSEDPPGYGEAVGNVTVKGGKT